MNVTVTTRGVRRFAAAALALALTSLNTGTAYARQGSDAFVRWVTARAVRIRTVEPEGGFEDLRPLKQIIGSARVVALGELAHGTHEPLAFRNRLLRFLVEEMGFTAVAIESGLTESRRVSYLVAGGPPGQLRQLVRENLTWGFGAFAENEELVRWLRDYNAGATGRRKVGFYGIALSLGGPQGTTPSPAPFEAALAYHVTS